MLMAALMLLGFRAMAQAPAAAPAVQGAVIEFKEPNHDFGTFKEESGPQKFRFNFINKGNAPVKVTNVQASCGCTTPGWSKDEVPPGGTGFVEAEYNPAGRPGAFNKSLTVTSTAAQNPTSVLTIKGTVTERVKTAADLYPRKFGNVRLVSEYLNLGRVSPDKEGKQSFKIYNEWSGPATIALPAGTPAHFKLSIDKTTLQPKETADITVTYDAKVKKDWGYVNDPIDIQIQDSSAHTLKAYVIATIEMEPTKLDEKEALKGPRMKFKDGKTEHQFGDLKIGDVVSTEFEFTNTGAKPLEIFKSKASCGCTASQPSKTLLAPGETGNIKVTFNTAGKHEGDQQQSVTLYTNDPVEPTRFLTIKAKIPAAAKPDESGKTPAVEGSNATDDHSKSLPVISTPPPSKTGVNGVKKAPAKKK